MGRPKGSKNRPKRPRIPKIPVTPEGKALPGRPRRDRLPPIQRKAALTPEQAAEQAVAAASERFLARIRFLAGRGLPPKFIASLINRDFPKAKAVPEDFEQQGRYHGVALQGRAEAALEVAEGMFDRAKSPTGKGVDPLFWLKCNADWSETPVGRQKAKAADDDDTFTGIDITVTD
jgi:hypothetical protein